LETSGAPYSVFIQSPSIHVNNTSLPLPFDDPLHILLHHNHNKSLAQYWHSIAQVSEPISRHYHYLTAETIEQAQTFAQSQAQATKAKIDPHIIDYRTHDVN
jgi:hypothetical protein